MQQHTIEYVQKAAPRVYSHELVDVIFVRPYCRIQDLVDTEIAERQTASRYLKQLVALNILEERVVGREKLFIHPKLMQLLTRDQNNFAPYA